MLQFSAGELVLDVPLTYIHDTIESVNLLLCMHKIMYIAIPLNLFIQNFEVDLMFLKEPLAFRVI